MQYQLSLCENLFAAVVINSPNLWNFIDNGVHLDNQLWSIKSTLKQDFKTTWSWLKVVSLTLHEGITSSMGLNVWLSCFCEFIHNTHTGCLSSRQKSLSFSLCKLQISSDPDEHLSFFSFRNDSHKFFNARLTGGSSLEDLVLQTGHSWVFLVLQNCWRHSLQKLWLHDRRTGVLKISWHTGQEKSSSDSEAISTLWGPAI